MAGRGVQAAVGASQMRALSSSRFHIVGSDTGAGALKSAVSKLRWNPLPGLRGYAPVPPAFMAPIDLLARPVERRAWFDAHASGIEAWWGLAPKARGVADLEATAWWDRLRAGPGPATVWYSSRDARDLSLVSALTRETTFDDDTLLVDVGTIGKCSVGECSADDILDAATQHAGTLGQSEIGAFARLYERLSQASLDLRRFDGNGSIVEATMGSHDVDIRAALSTDWRPYGLVMGEILAQRVSRGLLDLTYGFVLWRVDRMIASGEVERRGASPKPLFEEDPTMGDVRLVNG